MTVENLPANDVLLISTADWDNPFWTNKQHVALELANRGHRVFYIESLALRRPTMTGRDLSRIWRRLKRGLMPPRRVHERLWVWSPVVPPLHGSPVIKALNRMALACGMNFWFLILGLRPKLMWTYSPITADLFKLRGYNSVVYHAVDDIKEQPGMPRDLIATAEAKLLEGADLVFVTSQNLYKLHHETNPNTHYFPNVADYEHFQKALADATEVPTDLSVIPGPRLGLIGAISGYKIDFELLCEVAKARPDWSIVLIGEVGEGDPWTSVKLIQSCSNIHLMGPRPYGDLPSYLKGLDVAILANRNNEYTKSMFPMKFFEYLAAGRPVVSGPLDALKDYSDVAMFASSAEDFIQSVEMTLAGQAPTLEVRLERARANTYKTRTDKMMRIVAEKIAGSTQ